MTATPLNWHWRITPADITAIKAGNRETLNTVFLRNLDKFKNISRNYCRNAFKLSYVDDCINQIYVDFETYDFTDTRTLFWCIRGSLRRACLSSRQNLLSLDEPISEDGGTLEDTLCATWDGFSEIEKNYHERKTLEMIAEQTQLTDLQKDYLTAYAFGVMLYRGIFQYEYTQAVTIQY